MGKMLVIGLLMLLAVTSHAKDGRTYYDEPTMTRVREKIEKYEWAQAQARPARRMWRGLGLGGFVVWPC